MSRPCKDPALVSEKPKKKPTEWVPPILRGYSAHRDCRTYMLCPHKPPPIQPRGEPLEPARIGDWYLIHYTNK